MASRLARLLSLGGQEWLDLLRAQVALIGAAIRLRTRPLGSIAGRTGPSAEPVAGDAGRAAAISTAVRRAARFGLFRPYCLVQSLALRSMLEAAGVTGSSIRIGVRRKEGQFQAHAWIRWGDAILGDDAKHVATFTEVNDLGVLERR